MIPALRGIIALGGVAGIVLLASGGNSATDDATPAVRDSGVGIHVLTPSQGYALPRAQEVYRRLATEGAPGLPGVPGGTEYWDADSLSVTLEGDLQRDREISNTFRVRLEEAMEEQSPAKDSPARTATLAAQVRDATRGEYVLGSREAGTQPGPHLRKVLTGRITKGAESVTYSVLLDLPFLHHDEGGAFHMMENRANVDLTIPGAVPALPIVYTFDHEATRGVLAFATGDAGTTGPEPERWATLAVHSELEDGLPAPPTQFTFPLYAGMTFQGFFGADWRRFVTMTPQAGDGGRRSTTNWIRSGIVVRLEPTEPEADTWTAHIEYDRRYSPLMPGQVDRVRWTETIGLTPGTRSLAPAPGDLSREVPKLTARRITSASEEPQEVRVTDFPPGGEPLETLYELSITIE